MMADTVLTYTDKPSTSILCRQVTTNHFALLRVELNRSLTHRLSQAPQTFLLEQSSFKYIYTVSIGSAQHTFLVTSSHSCLHQIDSHASSSFGMRFKGAASVLSHYKTLQMHENGSILIA